MDEPRPGTYQGLRNRPTARHSEVERRRPNLESAAGWWLETAVAAMPSPFLHFRWNLLDRDG